MNFVKSYDMFGHVVNLNFDKQGPSHKTVFGGSISLFIKIVIYIYVIFNFKKLIFGEADKNSTLISLENLKDMGLVNYNTTSHQAIYVLRHQMGRALYLNNTYDDSGDVKKKGNNDRDQYIDIYFNQVSNDWYKNPGSNTRELKNYPAR